MSRRHKSPIFGYTIIGAGGIAVVSALYMSGASLRDVTFDNKSKTQIDNDAVIEIYMKEENTDNASGENALKQTDGVIPQRETKAPEPSTPIDATDTKSAIWKYLKSFGFSDESAAAVMGNIQWESGGFNLNATNGITYGLCQWTGGRRDTLKARPNYDTVDVQMDYFHEEWETFQYNSFCNDDKYAEYAKARADIISAGYTVPNNRTITTKEDFMKSTDIDQCTFLYGLGFERPGTSDRSFGTRCTYAHDIYNTFKGKV